MGGALVWVLLVPLLLLLHPGSQEICSVYSGVMDWTREFTDTCLNFSGQSLNQLPQNQSLQARQVLHLDLSGNGLRELPQLFFAHLHKLKTLDVTNNSLGSVDRELAKRCDLELKADCSCVLSPWHDVWQGNCSSQLPLLCLDVGASAWKNLSAFLEVHCPHGLPVTTIAALAASGSLMLVLAVTGAVLAWRFYRHRMGSGRGLSKTWAAQDGPRSGSGQQPRYSSRSLSSKPAAATQPPRSSTSDYENMFVGPPAAGHQWAEHRPNASEDSNFYMTYESLQHDSQPVYCNLQSLGQDALDEEEYVIPGR